MLLGHTSVRTTELYLGRGAEAREKAVQATNSFLTGALGSNLGTAVRKQDAE
jgi:hypothetical protein